MAAPEGGNQEAENPVRAGKACLGEAAPGAPAYPNNYDTRERIVARVFRRRSDHRHMLKRAKTTRQVVGVPYRYSSDDDVGFVMAWVSTAGRRAFLRCSRGC